MNHVDLRLDHIGFSKALHTLSANRLETYCSGMSIQSEALSGQEDECVSEHTSMILLWGEAGKILLKAHFDESAGQAWASQLLGKESGAINLPELRDFFNEYCNMLGGHLRGELERHSHLVGMSLPFCISGQDDSVFREVHADTYQRIYWRLSDSQHSIVCSCEVSSTSPVIFRQICKIVLSIAEEASSADDDDIEFL